MFTFSMVVILVTVFISVVNSHAVGNQNNCNYENNAQPIFQNDKSQKRLLINFKGVGEQLKLLNLRRGKQLVLHDDLSQMPQDAVYGLDLTQLVKGKYTVQLVTKSKNIEEEITID